MNTDTNIRTFSGDTVPYRGRCKYNLVSHDISQNGIPQFTVNLKMAANIFDSHIDYLEFHYAGNVIRISKQPDGRIVSLVIYMEENFVL